MTDDEFFNWLKSDRGDPVVLVELEYQRSYVGEDGKTPLAVDTLYLSNSQYATGPGDEPASMPYFDCVNTVPTFSREIDTRTLGGIFTYGFGSLELSNADHRMDFIIGLGLDNRPINFYIGDKSWPRADFRLVFSAMMQSPQVPAIDRIIIEIASKTSLLNSSIGGSPIGGTGPNADRAKAVVLGKCYQCELLIADSATLDYQASDRDAFDSAGSLIVDNVCDSGLSIGDDHTISSATGGSISINTSTDVISSTAHGFIDEDILYSSHDPSTGTLLAVSPSIPLWVINKATDTFQLSPTRGGSAINFSSGTWSGTWSLVRKNFKYNGDGTITISHTPAGMITADVLQPVDTGDSIFGSKVIERLAIDLAGLDGVDDWQGAHSTFVTEDIEDFTLGVLLPDAKNVGDQLTEISDTMRIFYGMTKEGKFSFGRIRPSELGFANPGFSPDDVVATLSDFFQDTLKVSKIMPQMYRKYTLIGNRNWATPNGLAAGIDPDVIARISGKGSYYRRSPIYSSDYVNPQVWNKSVTDSPEILTLASTTVYDDFRDTMGLYVANSHKLTFNPWVEIVEADFGIEYYGLELGDVVFFDMPFFNVTLKEDGIDNFIPDDAQNKYFQVIGNNIRLSERRVTLTLVHRRDPTGFGLDKQHA